MRVVDGVAYFKSDAPWYTFERGGYKPNTLRAVTDTEYEALKHADEIEITSTLSGESFRRDVSGVFDVSDFGKQEQGSRLALVCWYGTWSEVLTAEEMVGDE